MSANNRQLLSDRRITGPDGLNRVHTVDVAGWQRAWGRRASAGAKMVNATPSSLMIALLQSVRLAAPNQAESRPGQMLGVSLEGTLEHRRRGGVLARYLRGRHSSW